MDFRATNSRRGGGRTPHVPAPADRRRWWHVDCRDVANTRRGLAVLVNRDKVVLVGPPGHAAELNSRGAGQLSMALRDAAAQARK
ncbi:hypothetical protein EIL87_22635 [Saccharopolyspora rhizosphaerae]|uniref:Uncharacterized protein n=1 Tax=Saccharopolyspora rhizosphaerae TaxID=2492662 RepID=A0A426JKQ1_9PSEU|nr:hypothetical protein [Saccharopolyspora rhizosphaerae]RRO13778.1 hypothetical protein EIL87_22635 [Saccharopolyspora rhizosphaerae]